MSILERPFVFIVVVKDMLNQARNSIEQVFVMGAAGDEVYVWWDRGDFISDEPDLLVVYVFFEQTFYFVDFLS